jgi:Tfp pilus assembly protein PilX
VRTKDWFTRPLTLVLVVLLGLAGSVLLARARRRGSNRRRGSRAEREPEAA